LNFLKGALEASCLRRKCSACCKLYTWYLWIYR